jgi:hypothetical protein
MTSPLQPTSTDQKQALASSKTMIDHEDQAASYDHEATYSAEDDKLRIYFSYHLDREEYQRVIDLGFRNAPKQECHFAVWSPAREDFALEMAGEITPEGTTIAERAAAKAERLENLAFKNARKANRFHAAADSYSQRFAFGQPILVGHHSERSARRDKARMESAMNQAVRCAGMVDYWNYKATCVERHANYKNRDDVRGRRIKTLLAELRGYQRDINESYAAIRTWEHVETFKDNSEKFAKTVRHLAGYGHLTPWLKDRGFVSSLLDDGKMTPEEALEISLEHHYKIVESRHKQRWIEHTLNRLAYERSELGDVDRFDGDLTPVILQAFLREHGADSPKASKSEKGFKAVSDVYFPIHIATDLVNELDLTAEEWRDLMQSSGYEVPAKKPRKATTSDKVALPLINPTKEDAEKLQALWNARRQKAADENRSVTVNKTEVKEVVQARYSANSKGDYSPYSTIEIDDQGNEVRTNYHRLQPVKTGTAVCRIRIFSGNFQYANSVVVITDKPAKSLPINWEV